MTTKIILDVDTGTDDAVALMVAALSPDIELLGATTVNGNTQVHNCTENTLRVFDWIGLPGIPVHEGMSRPLARAQLEVAGVVAFVPLARRIGGDAVDNAAPVHRRAFQDGIGPAQHMLVFMHREEFSRVTIEPAFHQAAIPGEHGDIGNRVVGAAEIGLRALRCRQIRTIWRGKAALRKLRFVQIALHFLDGLRELHGDFAIAFFDGLDFVECFFRP